MNRRNIIKCNVGSFIGCWLAGWLVGWPFGRGFLAATLSTLVRMVQPASQKRPKWL